ncbi:MAG TPA: hypothetical protein VM938_16355 [Acidimicrobiales bacterium]|nr:hypothetical protein [Acidimicrobiales bacterium]
MGVLLAALAFVASGAPERARLWAAGVLVLVLAAVQNEARVVERLSGGFRVPAHWVYPAGPRAGVLWGLMLGPGLITEAPYLAFHGSCVAAVLSASPGLCIVAGAVFGVSRMLAAVNARLSTRLIAAMSRTVRRGRGKQERSLVTEVYKSGSRIILVAWGALALGSASGVLS